MLGNNILAKTHPLVEGLGQEAELLRPGLNFVADAHNETGAHHGLEGDLVVFEEGKYVLEGAQDEDIGLVTVVEAGEVHARPAGLDGGEGVLKLRLSGCSGGDLGHEVLVVEDSVREQFLERKGEVVVKGLLESGIDLRRA